MQPQLHPFALGAYTAGLVFIRKSPEGYAQIEMQISSISACWKEMKDTQFMILVLPSMIWKHSDVV